MLVRLSVDRSELTVSSYYGGRAEERPLVNWAVSESLPLAVVRTLTVVN